MEALPAVLVVVAVAVETAEALLATPEATQQEVLGATIILVLVVEV